MAIFRLSMEPLSRKKGRSATAAAAYRAGAKIHDVRTGITWDFTRRRGVEHTEIVLPEGSKASWALDREALWNAAELIEKRSDARTARQYELALPHEFTREQQIVLVRRFAGELAKRYQVAVDCAIHLPHRHGDERNVHAHLMATTRAVTETGLGAKTAMELSDSELKKRGLKAPKQQLVTLRAFWADIQNEKFRELGMSVRVDHRSLEAQGIEREPTSHLGPTVSAMHRRGMETEVGRRIAAEQRLAAQRRREQAAERERLEAERRELAGRIRDVSADLAAARRDWVEHRPTAEREAGERAAAERAVAIPVTPEAVPPAPEALTTIEATPAPKPTLEEIRAAAREQWQQEYGNGRGAASAEELRRHGLEEWLALRAERADVPAAAPANREQERGAGLSLSFGPEEERERISRLTTQELRQEIQDRRPEPVSRLVEQDAGVQAAVRAAAERRERFNQAQRRERQALEEAQAWRQAHTFQAKLHDLGVARAEFLVTRAATEMEARAERLTALTSQSQAELDLSRARAAATARIGLETAPERAERVTREFKELAQQHALQEPDASQRSAEWQATPEVLRTAIERFNQLPADAREESLQALVAQPEMTRTLGQALAQRHERLRDLDRGLDQGLEL